MLVGFLWGVTSAFFHSKIAIPRILSEYSAFAPGSGGGASHDDALLLRVCALAIPALICAPALALAYAHAHASPHPLEDRWRETASRGRFATRRFDLRAIPLGSYSGMVGVLVGLAVGVPFKSRVAPLLYPVSMRAALARALIGNAGLIGGFELIGALTPRRHVGLYAAMRFVKYALVPLYILLAAPHLFQWIGI